MLLKLNRNLGRAKSLKASWLLKTPEEDIVLFQSFQECLIVLDLHWIKHCLRDFPGGPVVKTLSSKAEDAGLVPGQEAKIPHAS